MKKSKGVSGVVGGPHNVSSGSGAPSGQSRPAKVNIGCCGGGFAKRMGYGVNGVGSSSK